VRPPVRRPRGLGEEERAVVGRVADESQEVEQDVVEGEARDGAGVEVCEELRVPACVRERGGGGRRREKGGRRIERRGVG